MAFITRAGTIGITMIFAPYLVLSLSGMMLLAGLAPLPAARHDDAQPAAVVPVASGVQYEFIGRYDVDQLNQILTKLPFRRPLRSPCRWCPINTAP